MDTKINFREYQPGDEKQIVPLLVEAFDDWQTLSNPMEYWKWKYQDYPKGPTFVAVAEIDEKIVGTDHAIPIQLKENQQTIPSLYGLDGMTHIDYRKRGINSGLREFKNEYLQKEKITINYAYTDNQILIDYHTRQNHGIFPYKYKQLLRINDIKKHLEAKNTKNPHLKRVYYQIKNTINKRTPENTTQKITTKTINKFDNRIDDFLQHEAEKYEFIPIKDREFLNWRYTDPRAGDYVIIQAEEQDQIKGYIVVKIIERTQGYPEGFIIELTSTQEKQVISTLTTTALQYLDQKTNAVRALSIQDHPMDTILREHGFVDTRKNPYIYYYGPTNHRIEDNIKDTSPSKTSFSFGDLHLF